MALRVRLSELDATASHTVKLLEGMLRDADFSGGPQGHHSPHRPGVQLCLQLCKPPQLLLGDFHRPALLRSCHGSGDHSFCSFRLGQVRRNQSDDLVGLAGDKSPRAKASTTVLEAFAASSSVAIGLQGKLIGAMALGKQSIDTNAQRHRIALQGLLDNLADKQLGLSSSRASANRWACCVIPSGVPVDCRFVLVRKGVRAAVFPLYFQRAVPADWWHPCHTSVFAPPSSHQSIGQYLLGKVNDDPSYERRKMESCMAFAADDAYVARWKYFKQYTNRLVTDIAQRTTLRLANPIPETSREAMQPVL